MINNNPNQKLCKKGNHLVDINNFSRRKIYSPDGKVYWCNECMSKYKKERLFKKEEGTIKAF